MGPDYERVTAAIADIMFGYDQGGRPVYAFADAETIRKVLQTAQIADQTVAGLSAIVRSSLRLDASDVDPFREQARAAIRHRSSPLATPPALPLLVLLSIVAEQMKADQDLRSYNYYSRLHRILSVPETDRDRVENDYRQVAVLLWGSLNSWLEAWEGERGVPTAYAIGGHPFIGLPMSQAVVRQHDRAGLHELFALEGLAPGMRLSPDEMSHAIDPYATTIPSNPLSSHLARFWQIPAARDRIIDAACLELQAWGGAGIDAVALKQSVVTARLLAFVRTFPRKSIEFNLMLPYPSGGPENARFKLADSESVIPTVAGPGGTTRLSGAEGASAVSLVEEQLAGKFGADDSHPFGRRPKRVTPLRWDDLQGAFVEMERISFGEDSIVLARTDTRLRVEKHLAAHARPGWRLADDLRGVPEGWLVYQQVQIVSTPAEKPHVDLIPLAPPMRTSLTLRGGFVLPGRLRKWSEMAPPEAVALAAGASSVCIRVYRGTQIDPAAVIVETLKFGELVILPLADRGLTDGEYVVAMFVDSATKPSSTAILRLRSARTPQHRVEDVDIRLVYSPESSERWPLSAGPADWQGYVNGAKTAGLELSSSRRELRASAPMPEFVPRERRASTKSVQRPSVGVQMDSDSCLNTGRHRFQLPPMRPGQPQTGFIKGECTTCGLVNRYPASDWAARKRESHTVTRVVPDIPPVLESNDANLEVAFDALNHVGTGSFTVFERIAAQVEGSGLFADSFLRRLEVIGHIDVSRDEFLKVTEWAVNTSTLVPTGEGRWVLVGSRSQDLLAQLEAALGAGAVMRTHVDAGLARIEVTGTLPLGALAEVGIDVLRASPVKRIAEALPPLSEVAAALKRMVVPRHRSAEFWDTTSASWVPAASLAEVGAYRLKEFVSIYAVRNSEDIENGTIGIGNAHIVKHIANMWASDSLVGYHSRSGSVIAPLGADLPTLYGRALALCSGQAPREIETHRMLQYPSVPRAVSDIIYDRMSR